jgi:hypothetical protein
MIFAHTYQAILDGRKTRTTRRPGKKVYHPGHSYSVQPGRTQKGVAHINIVSRQTFDRFLDMPREYSQGEGFSSWEEFRATYEKINGPGSLEAPCVHYEFVLSHE